MSLFKKLLCLAFSILTVILLYNFRTVPSGRLWENYSVLYIPDTVEDSSVVQAFNECQIEEFVSYENQRVPLLFKNESVEKSMFMLNSTGGEFKYLSERLNYFFDSSKQYRLYYVPNTYKDNLTSCVKLLEDRGNVAGIDSNFSYPWVLPLLTIVLALVLLFFAKNKILFVISSVIPVMFVFCNPFYSCTISAFLILIIFLMFTNIWRREGYLKKIFKSQLFYIFAVCSLILSLSNGFISFVFLILAFCSSLALLFICMLLQDDIERKEQFKYVYIRNARLTSFFTGRIKTVCLILFISTACIFAYFILNLSDSFSGHFARVLLPGESSISSKDLPNLNDYCEWDWNVVTYPYKSLNVKNNSDVVTYPHFVKENGTIKKIDQVFKYDDIFKNEVINSIDNLDFYSIEQVLKSQGQDSVFGYTASSSYNVSVFSIIMMIVTLGMLLFIYISAIIKKGGRE